MIVNKQIHLDNRPVGEAISSNFKLVYAQTPALTSNQVLVRHHFLSLDPYFRGRMNDTKSYMPPQALGEPIGASTVGEVIESTCDKYVVGDKVVGFGGWQEYSVADISQNGLLRKVSTVDIPLSAYLGAVGMPGITAWYGLIKICIPKTGDTIVVSAASGAVGSAAGALAKARGCRVVGIAGGVDKCKYVIEELGFDACIDYKPYTEAASLETALREACPNGIDCYFENVGGLVLDAVLPVMNAFGRIAMCGMIAGYDGASVPLAQPALILTNRLKVEGFIVSEHMQYWPEALKELSSLVASGKLRPRESVVQGIEAAPEAFLGLLKGKNFGKQLVKLF